MPRRRGQRGKPRTPPSGARAALLPRAPSAPTPDRRRLAKLASHEPAVVYRRTAHPDGSESSSQCLRRVGGGGHEWHGTSPRLGIMLDSQLTGLPSRTRLSSSLATIWTPHWLNLD